MGVCGCVGVWVDGQRGGAPYPDFCLLSIIDSRNAEFIYKHPLSTHCILMRLSRLLSPILVKVRFAI